MRLSDLERYGIPARLLAVWKELQGETLLPVQRQAVRKGLLGNPGETGPGRSLIVTAPTSSGKSFCAELAAARAIASRQKAILLYPLKSLAEEKFRRASTVFGSLGVDCLIVTGDHPENDRRFADGDYQLAIAIYEKLDLLLTASLDALRNVALVAVDELQMIAEPGRGALLERLLTKIVAATYRPTLLGLSAVIGDLSAARLADWLNAEVVAETTRPVDLIRGVATNGEFKYRSYNDGSDGMEPFLKTERGENSDAAILRQIKEQPGSTLVFVKSRRETIDLAFRLAAMVDWPSAESALSSLLDEEPSFLIRSLHSTLSHGVAFHNADLSADQRAAIEQAFIRKEIKVLFSTTTLALGVNLPADTVFLETVKFTSGVYGERPGLIPISRAEFDNMTGRAGRLGMAVSGPGRAVVLAESVFDQELLWRHYIDDQSTGTLSSAFDSMPQEDWLLSMIVSGLVRRTNDCERLLVHTFRNRGGEPLTISWLSVLERLAEHGLVVRHGDDGDIAATPVGAAIARNGLSCREGLHLLMGMANNRPSTPFGWTALALGSPDWTIPAGILTRRELVDNSAVKTLYQRFDHAVEEIGEFLPGSHRRQPLSYRAAAMLKATLALDDWCRLVPVQRLEERYQLHLGQLTNLGETAAHLVRGVAALLETVDRSDPIILSLRQHAFSLQHGLPVSMEEMHVQLGRVLRRGDFAKLHAAGIEELSALAELSSDELTKLLSSNSKADIIKELLKSIKEELPMTAPYMTSCEMIGSKPDSIEIDGGMTGDRYLVKINGVPLRLTGKSFKYFTKLAWARANRDGGWIYKEDIESGFNQARYLYRMKSELYTGLRSSWPVFENNRLGYYRLDVEPDKIVINFENLRNHFDYELRQLVPATRVSESRSNAQVSL
ncbi:MAG: DEAD/DEAH box helicase [Candidatus Zixiibacteriota bacterium]